MGFRVVSWYISAMIIAPWRLKWKLRNIIRLMSLSARVVSDWVFQPDGPDEVVRFGAHPRQFALVYPPAPGAPIRKTAVLFLHGGGWYSWSPQAFRFIGKFFSQRGFPTLLVGYRLVPDFRYPAQLEDSYAGLAAGLEDFRRRGLEIRGIIVGGQSAGAQLAALLAYKPEPGPAEKHLQSLIHGYYGISGPLDFSACNNLRIRQLIRRFTVSEENYRAADPIRYVQKGGDVPAFLVHGSRDLLVDVTNSLTFARRLHENHDCPVEVHIVPGGHHPDMTVMFDPGLPVITQAFTHWLEQHSLS